MKQVLGRLRRGITGAVLAGVMVPAALVLAAYVLAGRSDATTATLHADAYVGVEACVSCHQAEGDLWQELHHALAMQHATDTTVLGDFNDATFDKGGVTSTFFRRGDEFVVRTDGPDGSLQDFSVKFTFGVMPLQQYLLELPGGHLQALSIAWDSRPEEEGGQRWFHLYPDEDIPAGDQLHWTGRQQNWNIMCADCHSTNVVRNYDLATGTYDTTFSEINVACESCHGPGAQHLAWARQESGWEAIADMGLAVRLDERKDAAFILDPATGNSHREPPRETTREIETCAHLSFAARADHGDGDSGGPDRRQLPRRRAQ